MSPASPIRILSNGWSSPITYRSTRINWILFTVRSCETSHSTVGPRPHPTCRSRDQKQGWHSSAREIRCQSLGRNCRCCWTRCPQQVWPTRPTGDQGWRHSPPARIWWHQSTIGRPNWIAFVPRSRHFGQIGIDSRRNGGHQPNANAIPIISCVVD